MARIKRKLALDWSPETKKAYQAEYYAAHAERLKGRARACRLCNARKADKLPIEWLSELHA